MASYWLLKSEPLVFSIDDLTLSPQGTTCWEGVRNYQARNFLRAMTVDDKAFFYHSNAEPPAIVGIVRIVKAAYPDYFSWDARSKYFDKKSSMEHPKWSMVDVKILKKFSFPIPLDQLRKIKGLQNMELLRKGSRLSVQPVRHDEWKLILKLAKIESKPTQK